MNAAQRLEALRAELRRHADLYYQTARPEITDAKYDTLMRELEALEREHPEIPIPDDSPTRKVGAEPAIGFAKVDHTVPMLSLENAMGFGIKGGLHTFFKRIKERLNGQSVQFTTELKLDGLSLALRYESGVLKQAITRGNGKIGEDVTSNVFRISNLPPCPIGAADTFEVRGEVTMSKEAFRQLNREREERGEPLYSSPRNSAAGSLRIQDSIEGPTRQLEFSGYSLLSGKRQLCMSQWETLLTLRSMGFSINESSELLDNEEEVQAFCSRYESIRDNLPYEIDGVVVKVNSVEQQDELGANAKAPLWAVAFKFAPRQISTKLRKVIFQIGRSGVITPVAELEKVQLGGVWVSRATLHNEDYINTLEVAQGDEVVVERSGDVIPNIIKVAHRPPDRLPITMPRICPECGKPISVQQNVKHFPKLNRTEISNRHQCTNPECRGRLAAALEYFCSRAIMNIEGLGPSIIDALISAEKITHVDDLYKLQDSDLATLKLKSSGSARTLGAPRARQIIESRERSKTQPFAKVIAGLGIPDVGAIVAQRLASSFMDINDLMTASTERLNGIPGMTSSTTQSIQQFFSDLRNIELVKRLEEQGLQMRRSAPPAQGGGLLAGKVFVLTGRLPTLTREEASTEIVSAGGSVGSAVTRNTDVLIQGEGSGSKAEKARQLGIEVWTEDDLRAAIGKRIMRA